MGARLLGVLEELIRYVWYHQGEDLGLHGQRERPHGARREQE